MMANSPQMQNLQRTKDLLYQIKNSGNPQGMLNMLMQQNPQIRNVMQIVQENGGDPKKAFYSTAEKMGVNPNEIISMLK